MAKQKRGKELGLTMEEAMAQGTLFQSYQILGKFYTDKTAHTAPDVQFGQCSECDFSG